MDSGLIVRRLKAFTRLPFRNKITVARFVPTFVVVEVGLRLLPLTTLCRMLGVALDQTSREAGRNIAGQPDSKESMPKQALQVFQTAGLFYRGRGQHRACLPLSLIAARHLRSFNPTLVIGVRREGHSRQAHAWLQINGENLGGPGDFAPLYSASRPAGLSP